MTTRKFSPVALGLALLAAAPALAIAQTPPAESAFFTRNASTPGVTALPGVQYQVLTSGPATGAHPTRADDVTVKYEGRFLSGAIFNTSPDGGAGTTVFPLQKLIPGWIGVVRLMRPGDVWRIWIPSWLAYGAAGKETIPPDSTLVFRIELVSATPHPPEPPPPPKP